MTNSPGSSPAGSRSAPPRKRFALTGRSVHVDPARFAVRGDLADVALADRLFAPHYARAAPYRCVADVTVRAGADATAEPRIALKAGDAFHVLDQSAGWAWGHGDAEGSVGYVPAGSIAPA